jgi:transketolase
MTSRALAHAIRLDVLRMTSRSGASHVGSAFGVADILAVLYGRPVMRYRAKEPAWQDRDRFILSKGHAGSAVYAALAHCGFFEREKLDTYYADGSVLSGHVSHKGVPGVEVSTGSLGHGLGIGAGMALALKGKPGAPRVFVVLSDGECDEGSTWEAVMFAAHHRLDNLIAIVDYNKIQSLAPVADTLALEPFADKWVAFNWDVVQADGHDHDALTDALMMPSTGRPRVLLAHTVKGKGVSFMQHSVLWHYRCARGDEFDAALQELEGPDAHA